MSIFINDIIVFFDFKALLPVSGRKVSHVSVTPSQSEVFCYLAIVIITLTPS